MKLYLDADIFLALIKEEDRFKQSSKNFFFRYKEHELVTSTLACLEVWFYLYRHGHGDKALDSIRSISSLCTIIDFDLSDLENSVILAKNNKLSPADAVHASLAMNYDAIVSSDLSFDRIGNLKRVDFSKRN